MRNFRLAYLILWSRQPAAYLPKPRGRKSPRGFAFQDPAVASTGAGAVSDCLCGSKGVFVPAPPRKLLLDQGMSHFSPPHQPVPSLLADVRRPSKPRGTAAFRGYALVSVSGIGLPKCHSGPWSPRPLFGVSFLLEGWTRDRRIETNDPALGGFPTLRQLADQRRTSM